MEQTGKSFLDKEELEIFTLAFENWAFQTDNPVKIASRARVHLFFLLTRYGAMRSQEIFNCDCHKDIDLSTGQIHVEKRSLFLPVHALRSLRKILSLPESGNANFLRLDSGFIRRTFSAIAQMAGLNPELCSPRALRYARAAEMYALHIPVSVIARIMGSQNVLSLEKLLLPQKKPARTESGQNVFYAIVRQIETANISARLILELSKSTFIYAICQLNTLLNAEPALNRSILISIPPEAVIFLEKSPRENLNIYECEIINMKHDYFETRIDLKFNHEIRIYTLIPLSCHLSYDTYNTGEKVHIYIPPRLISLEATS